MSDEQFVDLTFPRSGIDVSMGFSQQRQGTTPVGINVRTFEPSSNRARGGQRAGLNKYLPTRPNGTAYIQELYTLIGVGYTPPGGAVQLSSSGRIVSLIAVSGGSVYVVSAGQTAWVPATNNSGTSPALNSTGVVRSAANNSKLWFADGAHWAYYNPADNTVNLWASTHGTLPVDTSNNTPRLICTWRGRTVLSGLLKDPQNWFMSRVSDPTDFDYAPFNVSPAQAICGNNSPLGFIGDVVTCMIPFSDDILIMGGDHTIYQFLGDPMAGGSISLISDSIGMAWGNPWCKGPDGTVYFFSNRTGIYAMMPGQGPPQRISQQIEQIIQPIDTGSNTIRMIWDDRFQGLHVFITQTSGALATTHYFWEQRSGAWWQDTFTNNNHNPLCCCVFDGNNPGDRVPLIGSWDGYVRAINPASTTDDGYAIASSVVIGPLLTSQLDMMLLKDLQAVLGATSGDVNYAVYVGPTAEQALLLPAVSTGVWTPDRNLTDQIRRSGHAVYVQITASNPWAMEGIRARIATKGRVQRRGV